MISKIFEKTAIILIKIYRSAVSPYHLPVCRFTPSCSKYAEEAIRKYGIIAGGRRAIKRILRCHPFSSASGYDPVR
ncbi:MAG: membrane protein insertion efficiency factor YidD [Candidatus Latescibacteria bacterium]|nr:membrane protein insertion efficiency factor YidD [bacterium]MBD3425425.1 membrane protein insertion efficiency factor YidD [Candidatus Latescibacterota bacterium]